jgi:hypothetical protein
MDNREEMKTIVLLMCGRNKLCKRAKAKDLYTSPRFQKSIEYAKILTDYSNIYVLSAKHGLLGLEQKIAPYNISIYEMSLQEKKAWADMVIKSLSNISNLKEDKYIFLTDDDYNKELLPFLSNIELPLKNIPQEEHITIFNDKIIGKEFLNVKT